MPKRKRNTRGECKVKSESEKEPKTEPEVKLDGPEVKPKEPEVQEPKLDHTGTNQK